MSNKRLVAATWFLGAFSALLALLGYGLFYASDPKEVPSALISKPAADFTVEDLNGDEFSLSSFRGRPVIVNFWASWCPPCKEEASILEAGHRKYGGQGVVFIGIAMNDTVEKARKAAADFGKTFRLALDPDGGSLSIDYGVTGVPETFFIGADQTIRKKKTGVITPEDIDTFIESEL